MQLPKFATPIAVLLLSALATVASAASGEVELHLELDRDALRRGGQAGLEVLANVQRGWHINGHQPTEAYLIATDVTVKAPEGVTVEPLTYPPPDSHSFAFAKGKELLVYEGKVGITTAITVPATYKGDSVRLTADMQYQACNDTTCMPPTSASAELIVPVSDKAATAPDSAPNAAAGNLDIGRWLAQKGLATTLLLVFFLGLGLNLTPCVYPLISVTIAYFGSQTHHNAARTAALACVYVLGITITFSGLGVVAALSGNMFGAALQSPLVVVFVASTLVALALSSFGLYQLRPPVRLMQYVGGAAPGVIGSLFMGGTMGIVAAPCVGPVVLGLLLFVGSQKNVALGTALFVALGLGMGVPYIGLALAAGSIKRLPRSGEWMLWVERLFGFLLLGLAIYFIKPLLPLLLQRWLTPTLLATAGLYLGFIDPAGRDLRYFRTAQWITGTVALVLAVWLAVPRTGQGMIAWHPLQGMSFEQTRGERPALIDFVADWCIPCHEMEGTTFADSGVMGEAGRFTMFRADVTHENEETSKLVDHYRVEGVPTVIYVDSRGQEVNRLVGYVGPVEMLAAMRQVR